MTVRSSDYRERKYAQNARWRFVGGVGRHTPETAALYTNAYMMYMQQRYLHDPNDIRH